MNEATDSNDEEAEHRIEATTTMFVSRPRSSIVGGLAVAAVIGAGILGYTIGSDSGDNAPSDLQSPASSVPTPSTEPEQTEPPGDTTPSGPTNLSPPPPTDLDPIPAPGLEADFPGGGALIYGFSSGQDFSEVDLSTGEVRVLLPGAGDLFIPMASDGEGLIGPRTDTGVFFVFHTDERLTAVDFDIRDAPLFYALGSGSGYVMHGTWTGQVTYLDRLGEFVSLGPVLARGTRVVADAVAGMIIEDVGGNYRLIDHETGASLIPLAANPLAVGGSRAIFVLCDDGTSCRVVVSDLDGTNQVGLPITPERAHRVVAGISPDGRWVSYRYAGDMAIVDGDNGEVVTELEGFVSGEVTWLESDLVVVSLPDGTAAGWVPDTGQHIDIDLGSVIDPEQFGLWPLRQTPTSAGQ